MEREGGFAMRYSSSVQISLTGLNGVGPTAAASSSFSLLAAGCFSAVSRSERKSDLRSDRDKSRMGEGSAERNVRGREMIEGRKIDWTVINYASSSALAP